MKVRIRVLLRTLFRVLLGLDAPSASRGVGLVAIALVLVLLPALHDSTSASMYICKVGPSNSLRTWYEVHGTALHRGTGQNMEKSLLRSTAGWQHMSCTRAPKQSVQV